MGPTIVLGVLGILSLGFAWWLDRRRRLYSDTATTPAAAVFMGHNEVKGRAWVANPSVSKLTSTPSVRWSYVLQEEREHGPQARDHSRVARHRI